MSEAKPGYLTAAQLANCFADHSLSAVAGIQALNTHIETVGAPIRFDLTNEFFQETSHAYCIQ